MKRENNGVIVHHKGIMYTVTTFMIFIGIFAYVFAFANLDETDSTGISSERVYHYWKSTSSGVENLANISMSKDGFVFEINDSLPAENDMGSLLGRYSLFIDQFFSDKTIDVHFEDADGNKVSLEDMSSKIKLSPMNISYGWDSWGKNEMQIMSPVSSLGYISSINMTVYLVNETVGNDSITWGPYKDCRNNQPCLNLYLYISDGTKTITSMETTFDLTRDSKSDVVYCADGNCWLRFRIGPWGGGDPQNVLKIELQNLNITADTKIILNTSSFYTNFPTKLFVGTDFASKSDYIS